MDNKELAMGTVFGIQFIGRKLDNDGTSWDITKIGEFDGDVKSRLGQAYLEEVLEYCDNDKRVFAEVIDEFLRIMDRS